MDERGGDGTPRELAERYMRTGEAWTECRAFCRCRRKLNKPLPLINCEIWGGAMGRVGMRVELGRKRTILNSQKNGRLIPYVHGTVLTWYSRHSPWDGRT
jgi:hypothetical protein